MNLIDRYVYAVIKALPAKQRSDIEKELRTLIDDMLEQYKGSEAYEVKVQKVLLDLGDPEKLADNYRGSMRYLIGPGNYDQYMFIIKTVLGAVFLGISIASIVGFISASEQDIAGAISNYIASLFSGLLQGFAWVTLGFAIAERSGKTVMGREGKEETWSISELPELPHAKTVISPAEPIVSILLSAVLLSILYFAPQLFAAYIHDSAAGTTIIPVFNAAVIKGYRLVFAGIFILTVAKEVLKLVSGKWTPKVSAAFSVLSVIACILTLVVFANPAIWSSSFLPDIVKVMGTEAGFPGFWDKMKTVLLLVIAATCIIDVSKALYRGIRYNTTE